MLNIDAVPETRRAQTKKIYRLERGEGELANRTFLGQNFGRWDCLVAGYYTAECTAFLLMFAMMIRIPTLESKFALLSPFALKNGQRFRFTRDVLVYTEITAL